MYYIYTGSTLEESVSFVHIAQPYASDDSYNKEVFYLHSIN
jgi:hypothetical protein